MKLNTKHRLNIRNILLIFFVIIFFAIGIAVVSKIIQKQNLNTCFNELKNSTNSISNDFGEHIHNDSSRLEIIANILSNEPTDVSPSHIQTLLHGTSICEYSTGFGILANDNTVINIYGDISEYIDCNFNSESKRGKYIERCGLDNTGDSIVNAVPVIKNGYTVAMLYSTVSLTNLKNMLSKSATSRNLSLLLVDNDNGTYMADTRNNRTGKLVDKFRSRQLKKPYKAESVLNSLLLGESGVFEATSQVTNNLIFAYYTRTSVNHWSLLAFTDASNALQETMVMTNIIHGILVTFVLIVLCSLLALLYTQHKWHKYDTMIHNIEQLLLDDLDKNEALTAALDIIGKYKKSDITLFMHIHHNKIKDTLIWTSVDFISYYPPLSQEESQYLLTCMLKNRSVGKSNCFAVNNTLKKNDSRLFNILDSRKCNRFIYSLVLGKNDKPIGAVCVVNPRRYKKVFSDVESTANDIARIISNADYLTSMKKASLEDNLTRLMNRHAYTKAMLNYNLDRISSLACIYIDANGLHTINNTEGHEAGDLMLKTIASVLRNTFGSQNCYRIGGDEFTVLADNCEYDDISHRLKRLEFEIGERGYSVATGCCWRNKNIIPEMMMKEAERKMYNNKYQYYTTKSQSIVSEYNNIQKDIVEINHQDSTIFISAVAPLYDGVYIVDLDTDTMRPIYIPQYFAAFIASSKGKFSTAMHMYASTLVRNEHVRAFDALFDYSWLKKQLEHGFDPSLIYEKTNGTKIKILIKKINSSKKHKNETIWIFRFVE